MRNLNLCKSIRSKCDDEEEQVVALPKYIYTHKHYTASEEVKHCKYQSDKMIMLIYLDCDDDADDASIKKDQRHFS